MEYKIVWKNSVTICLKKTQNTKQQTTNNISISERLLSWCRLEITFSCLLSLTQVLYT